MLPIAMIPAMIYLTPIENITLSNDKYERQYESTIDDYSLQSNALFTLLQSEKVFPIDFTTVRNCISGQATTMNGFAALHNILKSVNPKLMEERPDSTEPVLSDCNDVHLYECHVRNDYIKQLLTPEIRHFKNKCSKQKYLHIKLHIQPSSRHTQLQKLILNPQWLLDK